MPLIFERARKWAPRWEGLDKPTAFPQHCGEITVKPDLTRGMAVAAPKAANLVAEVAALGEAGRELATLRAEVLMLEGRLVEIRPRLAEGSKAVGELRPQMDQLRSKISLLGTGRQEATERIGQVTKRQLAEIKQLTRSPPDSIRRTLIALWLLLHADRFQGHPTVRFDEAKDWPRCQRMLADEGFIGRILDFSPELLDTVPHVPRHIASFYFGMSVGGNEQQREDAVPSSPARCTSPSGGGLLPSIVPTTPPPPRALSRASTTGSSPDLHGEAPRRSVSKSSSTPGRGTFLVGLQGMQHQPKAPLEVEAVSRASQPVGALLSWMLELIVEVMERARLQKELANVDAQLGAAEARRAAAENDAAEVEAALAKKKQLLAEKTQALEKLQQEQLAAQKAMRDMRKLEALAAPPMPKPTPTSTSSCKVTTAEPSVEVEVSGTMAHIENKLSRLCVKFDKNKVEVLEGDAEMALVLPKIASILTDHKGKLKLLLEGHCCAGECDQADVKRSFAVYNWLVRAAGVPPGMLRN
eukprot:gnl/TRDRNA2_/TRDRNA2_172557_c0_seq1.p1 gnl/TRDRNA2_/TRDRNA2_172557_c0~~gnl/TRDRNA2_/TRDRNA2_172557_c0_seq1.p1  ORF type:complete len:527 (+),score=121.19 gnl/TRDRNA2_/TRDRNA2_172557_c0_seq1:174-1754(+)